MRQKHHQLKKAKKCPSNFLDTHAKDSKLESFIVSLLKALIMFAKSLAKKFDSAAELSPGIAPLIIKNRLRATLSPKNIHLITLILSDWFDEEAAINLLKWSDINKAIRIKLFD